MFGLSYLEEAKTILDFVFRALAPTWFEGKRKVLKTENFKVTIERRKAHGTTSKTAGA